MRTVSSIPSPSPAVSVCSHALCPPPSPSLECVLADTACSPACCPVPWWIAACPLLPRTTTTATIDTPHTTQRYPPAPAPNIYLLRAFTTGWRLSFPGPRPLLLTSFALERDTPPHAQIKWAASGAFAPALMPPFPSPWSLAKPMTLPPHAPSSFSSATFSSPPASCSARTTAGRSKPISTSCRTCDREGRSTSSRSAGLLYCRCSTAQQRQRADKGGVVFCLREVCMEKAAGAAQQRHVDMGPSGFWVGPDKQTSKHACLHLAAGVAWEEGNKKEQRTDKSKELACLECRRRSPSSQKGVCHTLSSCAAELGLANASVQCLAVFLYVSKSDRYCLATTASCSGSTKAVQRLATDGKCPFERRCFDHRSGLLGAQSTS